MFYVAASFFRIMLKTHDTEPMLEALTAKSLLSCISLHTYGPLVRVEFAASSLPGIMGFHFPAGILLHHPARHENITGCSLMTAGLLSGLAIAAAIMASESLGPLVYNNAPPQMLFTCAVFLFFRKHGDSLFARIPTLLSAIGRYSFSILLVHWLVLHRIVDDVFGINGLSFGIAGGMYRHPFLLTPIISLALAFPYDNTVVLCMDRACEILFGALGRVRKRP
ncbi:MAG: hypothetical protein ACLR0U_00200 [Enterocloster clostridioformis]